MDGLGASLINAGGNLAGSLINSFMNMGMTQDMMKFQKEMRATQYQTAVKDLQKAGLNPMLAYTNGGAGNITPPAVPHFESGLGRAVSSALETKMAYANYDKIQSEVRNTNANTEERLANISLINQDINKRAFDSLLTEAQVGLANANTQKTNIEKQISSNELLNWQERYQAGLDNLSAQTRNALSSAAQSSQIVNNLRTENALSTFKLPGAENEAEASKSWWGRNVKPYYSDINKGISSAVDLKNSIRR